jgi:hypothetical protein
MALISKAYLEQNRLLHRKRSYGAGGYQHLRLIERLIIENHICSVLDYGAGKGTLKNNLAKRFPFVAIQNYDPVTFPVPPFPAELVVCTDVLEHIEPECLEAVLDHLKSLTQKLAFFSICTRPAKKALPDGRNAHLIQERPSWWLDRLVKWEILQWDESPGDIEVQLK